MCSAIGAAIGLQAAGGIMGAAGAKESAAATRNYYMYLAKQNDVEAGVTEVRAGQDVTMTMDQALQDEKARAANVHKLEGAQVTTLAAHGVGGGSKTAENIAMDTLSASEKDAAALRYNADLKSWQTRTAASDKIRALKGQATAYRYAGDNAIAAGDAAATSDLIGGAGNIASTWMNWNRTSKGK
jgi:hypothetical protein